jgi:hypothetical protein
MVLELISRLFSKDSRRASLSGSVGSLARRRSLSALELDHDSQSYHPHDHTELETVMAGLHTAGCFAATAVDGDDHTISCVGTTDSAALRGGDFSAGSTATWEPAAEQRVPCAASAASPVPPEPPLGSAASSSSRNALTDLHVSRSFASKPASLSFCSDDPDAVDANAGANFETDMRDVCLDTGARAGEQNVHLERPTHFLTLETADKTLTQGRLQAAEVGPVPAPFDVDPFAPSPRGPLDIPLAHAFPSPWHSPVHTHSRTHSTPSAHTPVPAANVGARAETPPSTASQAFVLVSEESVSTAGLESNSEPLAAVGRGATETPELPRESLEADRNHADEKSPAREQKSSQSDAVIAESSSVEARLDEPADSSNLTVGAADDTTQSATEPEKTSRVITAGEKAEGEIARSPYVQTAEANPNNPNSNEAQSHAPPSKTGAKANKRKKKTGTR